MAYAVTTHGLLEGRSQVTLMLLLTWLTQELLIGSLWLARGLLLCYSLLNHGLLES